jgi:cellulose synthase/poly-beta-1,6-N-acetylglucosamine synthase-like glycosyltransferase
MGYTILHITDWLLWIIMAVSVFYALFFSLTSLLPRHQSRISPDSIPENRFLALFPAYHEDSVIIHSIEAFLKQIYPATHYQVIVISDHMQLETNQKLADLPIMLLQPSFEQSSKAKALQYAMREVENFDYVVILDADNLVDSDFLTRLNQECSKGYQAIQCHRTAKNADNAIAALDGLSEEINNSIFRKGHNRIGMSSALIGSGMCFNFQWFKEHVNSLDSAVEDRELEALLMKQRIFIHYAEDINVMDEKVSNSDNFQRQRLRWMTGQVQTLLRMLPYIPKAIITGNINYIDKTIQQALIPRSILLILIPLFILITTLIAYLSPLTSYLSPMRWCLLLILLCIALFIAIPRPLRNKTIFSKIFSLPRLAWKMLKNLLHIRTSNKEFIHTTHNQ